jgi:hypothetical protein
MIIRDPVIPKHAKDLTTEFIVSHVPNEPIETLPIRKVGYLALEADHLRESARRLVLLGVGIRTKDDAAEHGIDALMLLATKVFASTKMGNSYHGPEREHVGRFVEFALEVTLRAAPVLVSGEHPFNASPFREIGGVFKIYDLDAFDSYVLSLLVVVDHNVVGFHV